MDKNAEIEMEAAVFRSLRTHLQNRTDVQNIDMIAICRTVEIAKKNQDANAEGDVDILGQRISREDVVFDDMGQQLDVDEEAEQIISKINELLS